MSTARGPSVLRQLRQAVLGEDGDAELLERFLSQRDGDAFAALVRRHGPMVLGVCRRALRHEQDAEDAFQAAFLVLVRKAGSIRKRESLGSWLHGVAHRTALEARSAAARRGGTEKQVTIMPEQAVEAAEVVGDLHAVLDAELSRLPDKYRTAIVLCDLEGMPRREAAQALAIAEGTLSSRLVTGRRRLAERLARRGLTLSASALAVSLGAQASAATLPFSLLHATTGAAAGVISANVLALTERMVRTMLFARLQVVAGLVLALVLAGAGAGLVWNHAAASERAKTPPRGAAEAQFVEAAAQPKGDAPKPTVHESKAQALAKDPRDVWTIDLRFKDPRVVTVKMTGLPKRELLVLHYELINRTGKPRVVAPRFLLMVDGQKPIVDEVFAGARFAQLTAIEDPTGILNLKNSVTVSHAPIPIGVDGTADAPIAGLATWDNIDPKVEEFVVVIEGISNGSYSVTEGKQVVTLYKAVELSFKRDGGKFVFVPPARWVYRKHLTAPQDVPKEKPAVAADPLKEARARIEVEEQKLAQIVETTIRKANAHYPEDATAALDLLRAAVLQVWDHPDLGERTRNALLKRLVTARRELGNKGPGSPGKQ